MCRYGPDELGPPDLEIAGFQVWIWNRRYQTRGTTGTPIGPILHLADLRHWLDELNSLIETLSGTATLPCIEPNLSAALELRDGRGVLTVHITPDDLMQKNEFRFEVDQSYLPTLTSMLHRMFERYPVQGKR